MASISAADVKKLRDMTGAGMMDCKKALTEANGDFEQAIKLLREKGMADAAKRMDRAANEGKVISKISDDRKKAVLIRLNCETDFVARTDDFVSFANEVINYIFENNIKTLEEATSKLEERIKEAIAKLGENIKLTKLAALEINGNGGIYDYIHKGGKIGVIVALSFDNDDIKESDKMKEFGEEMAIHIASMSPIAISPETLDEAIKNEQREIFKKQVMELGKPENIAEKIVDGKMKKYYTEVCLLNQSFYDDDKKTVAQFIEENTKAMGTKINVEGFARFALGED